MADEFVGNKGVSDFKEKFNEKNKACIFKPFALALRIKL